MKPLIHAKAPRRLASVVACALLLAGLPAPAQIAASTTAPQAGQLPALGDGSDMSLGAERRIGDRIAKEIYRDPDYVDDPLLQDYVASIWQPLQTAARARGELSPEMEERFAWGLMLVRDRTVNAFALPGGYMGVHTGLIGLVTSRDELASVLAHELSHITQRHIARGISKQGKEAPWMIAAMILGVLAASKSPNAANAMIAGGQAVAMQSQLNFSRDMEREADRVGFNVMTQAGYQPQAFVSMFEKLQQSSRLNDSGAYPYLRSHPLTSQRIADMQLRVSTEPTDIPHSRAALPSKITFAPTATDITHSMMAARARVLSDPGAAALRVMVAQAQHNPTDATSQAATLYSAVLASIKLREFSPAQQLLTQLQATVRWDTAATRLARLLAVELALQSGDIPHALATVNTQAVDRAELFLLAQIAAQTAGQTTAQLQQLRTTTLEHLQNWLTTHPHDAGAWQQLARVATAQNQVLRGIYAEAEAQAAALDYPAAVDRFRAGQDFARSSGLGTQPGDHIETSIIDTRLREVQTLSRDLLREQAQQR